MTVVRLSSAMSPLGGVGPNKSPRQPHERCLCVSEKSALQGDLEADQEALPSARSERLDRLPLSWCAGWSANGEAQWHVPARRPDERSRRFAPADLRASTTVTRLAQPSFLSDARITWRLLATPRTIDNVPQGAAAGLADLLCLGRRRGNRWASPQVQGPVQTLRERGGAAQILRHRRSQ